MLQVVRKYTQGWVSIVMGIILSFAFVLWGIENYLGGHSKNSVAAKVNGQEITTAQINSDFQRMIMRFKDQIGSSMNLPPVMQEELKVQALNNLIVENVLSQAAYKAGFRVTPQETSAMIKQMPAFQVEGRFSKERFEQIINRMGYTKQEFIDEISKTLLLNQVTSGIAGSAFVLPNEQDRAISLLEQRRDIQYAIIPSAQFKKTVNITPEQIKVYYLQHKDQFKKPAKLQIEYVQLSSADLKKKIVVTEQDIKEYFDVNNELDRKNTQAIAKAKELIQQQKIEKAFLTATDKLTDVAYTHPDTLTEAANAVGLQIKTSEYFTEEGGNSAVTKNPKVIANAFNPETIKNHTNSNLIELNPGNVIVMRVKDFQPEALLPIDEVKEKIKHQLIDANASIQARKKGQELLQNLKDKSDFKKLAAKEHFTVISKSNIARHEKGLNVELLRMAFEISPADKIPVGGTQLTNGDSIIVMVDASRDLPVEKITAEQRATMQKLYSDTYGKLDYGLYLNSQMDRAKIKTYQNQKS